MLKLNLALGHGYSPVEHGPQLVATIESLLPVLGNNSDDALAEFVAKCTEAQSPPFVIDIEHYLYFNSSLMLQGTRSSIVLISPKGECFKYVLQIPGIQQRRLV